MSGKNLQPLPKTAIILIGIPASGKSTFCEQRFSEYVHINLDTLNTRNKEKLLMESCFDAGSSLVVDNTNPTRLDRRRYITPAKERGYRVEGYFMQSKVKDCVERNKEREGKAKIPSTAIAAISNILELPQMDEGFDTLYFVKIHGDGFFIEKWRNDSAI